MKCSKCSGAGYIYNNLVCYAEDCSVCHGKGEVQTNEEWFCGLSTEEKAKFLFEHGVIGCQFCKGDCVEIDYKTKECKYDISPSYSYTGIVMWLKEIHK